MKIKIFALPWPDAPYRTTLIASKAGLKHLVEAQGTLTYAEPIRELAMWLIGRRAYTELYLAIMHHTVIQAGLLGQMKKDGVGLLIVEEDASVSVFQRARSPALQVTPEPTLTYGKCKAEVNEAVRKFNGGERKDGLRDMCELVERETDKVVRKATKKGHLNINEQAIENMNWSDQINILAAAKRYHRPYRALVDQNLRNDFHSFRGARNLVDHKVKSKREDAKRQKQFAERMMQGPRLVSDLVSLHRKVK